MADLKHERELARLEQERLERLKAEELLFQQVRQGREPEAMELAMSASCDAAHMLKDSPSLVPYIWFSYIFISVYAVSLLEKQQ